MPSGERESPFEVLVVDDQVGVRDLLTDFFTGQGFSVAAAADGRAAVSLLERNPGRFGLVVTDLNLPGADGFAVLLEARRANPACYVVIVTGYASLDSAIQAVRMGAYDYLPKPFSLGQLDLVVKRIKELWALEQASRGRTARPGGTGSLSTIEAQLASIDATLRRLEDHLSLQLATSGRR